MESFVYEFYNVKVELKGKLIESEKSYGGKEQISQQLDSGMSSIYTVDVITFKEKWKVVKTDQSKEVIDIIRKEWRREKDDEKVEETILWDYFRDKMRDENYYYAIQLAKEYGSILKEDKE